MTTLTANRINFKDNLYRITINISNIVWTETARNYEDTGSYNDFSLTRTNLVSLDTAFQDLKNDILDYFEHIGDIYDPYYINNLNINSTYLDIGGEGQEPDSFEISAMCEIKTSTPPSSGWTSLLNMLYPIGSTILWSDNNVSPTERYGGRWTLLSSDSAYKGQFLAITNSSTATGGADISNVTWTPSGKSSNVTVTPGMCNIASGTTMYAIPHFSDAHSYTHSHTFPNSAKVAKSVTIGSTLCATLNFGSSGTQNYYAMAVYNKNTMDHNHQGMHDRWMATWINYHSHSFPSITAANAATAHSHTFTGSTSSINFTPAGYSLQLWRRDE